MAPGAHICRHPPKASLHLSRGSCVTPAWALACVAWPPVRPPPPRTHNPLLWIQGDSYPRPPPAPARLPLASIKTCLCMYVCAEGNTGRFFKGWGEISRGIWGRWIWMGSLLLESTADREVNSSWPGEGGRGERERGGGEVVDACTGIQLGPNSISLPLCYSLTISEDYLSLFRHLILLLYCRAFAFGQSCGLRQWGCIIKTRGVRVFANPISGSEVCGVSALMLHFLKNGEISAG